MLGKGELRTAYLDRKKQIEYRAEQKRQQAKTRIQEAKVKAEKAKELADLEAAMYQAQIAAQNAQKRARVLRIQSGNLTVGERVSRFAKETYGVGKSFYRGLQTQPRKRATARKKR